MRLRKAALLLLLAWLSSCAPARIVLLPSPPVEVRKEEAAPAPAPVPAPPAPAVEAPGPAAPAPPPVDFRKSYADAIARTRELLARKDWRAAIPLWKDLEESPWREDAVFHQGVLLQLAGDLDGAAERYRSLAGGPSPHEPAAANLLGILLLRGEMEEARTLADRLLAEPSPPGGMLPELQANVAAVLAEEGRLVEAATRMLALQAEGAKIPVLAWNLAVLAHRNGDLDAARKIAAEIPAETASLWPVVASRFAMDPEGRPPPTLSEVPATEPRLAAVAANLAAHEEYRKGNLTGAERILSEARSGGRLAAALETNRGILQAEQGRWKDAREALERAVREHPSLPAGWLNLGIFLEIYAGDPEGARTCYEQYGIQNGGRKEEVRRWADHLGRSVPSSP